MKVSKKVGRRIRKHTSSVSRRRLRNKNKKSSYKKKHTKRGGKRGRGHKHMRTYKRGRRFHRGGVLGFGKEDIESSSTSGLEPTINTTTIPIGSEATAVNLGPPPMPKGYDDFDSILNAPSISSRPSVLTATAQQPMRELPMSLTNPLNKNKELNKAMYTKKPSSVTLEYKKDYIPGKPEPKQFDVFIPAQRVIPVVLLRHDSDNLTKYDKMFDISIDKIERTFNILPPQPIIDIQATNPYTGTSEGTYTFPVTQTNIKSFRDIIAANLSG